MKIQALSMLEKTANAMRKNGKFVVQCHGCFDVLHIGHVRHFQDAAEYGNLIVTVTSDRFVNKGANRPIFKIQDRLEMIAALQCVDYVSLVDGPDSSDAIALIKPDYYVKGIDYADKGISELERTAIKNIGGRLVFTSTEKYSTTEIIQRLQ